MNGFLIYYTATGAIMAAVCAVNYKKICEKNDIMSDVVRYIGRDLFVIINFFVGFLNAPICIPIMIKSYFLKKKLKKLREENERLTRIRDELKESVRKGEEFNEYLKNKLDKLEENEI